jgi:hypothetical protein
LALARHAASPKIYLIGRSQEAADTTIADLKEINPSAQPSFIQSDVSLLKNVDTVCAEIAAKESKLNLLFMTPAVGLQTSRMETAEGLDRKMALHYYTRARFATKLLPLLSAAAQENGGSDGQYGSLSRVVSVLDPHGSIRHPFSSGALDYDDLDLKKSFGVTRCASHATLMTDFYLEGLAAQHPQTSFVHSYPSAVPTSLARASMVGQILVKIGSALMVPVEESGERHLYASTHSSFAPKGRAGEDAATGSDGKKGSGSYWLNWDDEALAPNKKLERTRADGAVEKVTQHTEEVMTAIEVGGKYP